MPGTSVPENLVKGSHSGLTARYVSQPVPVNVEVILADKNAAECMAVIVAGVDQDIRPTGDVLLLVLFPQPKVEFVLRGPARGTKIVTGGDTGYPLLVVPPGELQRRTLKDHDVTIIVETELTEGLVAVVVQAF